MRNFRRFQLAVVCLAFTGGHVAWADPATSDDIVPTAPKADNGSTVRAGTAAGFIYGAPSSVFALGAMLAIGQRFGRLGIEAEGMALGFAEREQYVTPWGATDGNVQIGSGYRLGAIARYDLVRFGPHVDRSPRSIVTLYVEGGAAVAWNRWSKPSSNEIGSRIVPQDTKRDEGQAGFGIMIFPHRVAWLIGWRVGLSPHQDVPMAVCRGTSCRAMTTPSDDSVVDRSMLFQSSLEVTF